MKTKLLFFLLLPLLVSCGNETPVETRTYASVLQEAQGRAQALSHMFGLNYGLTKVEVWGRFEELSDYRSELLRLDTGKDRNGNLIPRKYGVLYEWILDEVDYALQVLDSDGLGGVAVLQGCAASIYNLFWDLERVQRGIEVDLEER
jgi:hypothetical protein